MEAIHIPRLLSLPHCTEKLVFNGRLPDLATLTPVRGTLTVAHRRTYLEVCGQAETIVTLTCDRTLQQYNHRLAIDTSEIIWLNAAAEPELAAKEVELTVDDLTESLPPDGYFDPQRWLYEQLCLALPLRQVSEESRGVDCNYTDSVGDSDDAAVDARWSALEALKERLARSE